MALSEVEANSGVPKNINRIEQKYNQNRASVICVYCQLPVKCSICLFGRANKNTEIYVYTLGLIAFRRIILVVMLLSLNGQILGNVEPIFTLNKGQYPQNVLAKAVLNSIQFWVCEDGFRVQRFDEEELESLHDKTVEQKHLHIDQVWMEFVGGKAQKIRHEGDSSKTIYNYFN